jgi:hypothetical protein
MNIIKIQNMLRGVPDDALIGYVQNPIGEVPSYLALSELQRRKDTREKYQAQQAPESSVAEDLEQETMSDQGGLAMLAKNPDLSPGAPDSQGVASLPVDDAMYQEDSFASGGIVAFPVGGYVSADPRPNYYGEDEEEVTSPMGRFLKYLDISGQVKKSDFGKRREERKKIDEQIQETIPTLIGGKRGFFDKETKAEQRAYDQKRKELQALKDQSPFFAPEPGGFVYDKKDAIDPTMSSYIAQEIRGQKINKNVAKDTPSKTQPATSQVAQTQTSSQATESDEDYLRNRMRLMKEFMGDDTDRKELKAKLDAMEKRAARQEELAPWMALTEAGFKTMAGTSPFALTNLGAGAQAGVQSYGAAQDKLASLEEKRYALMNEAAKADRAEKQAIAKFGFDSLDAKTLRDQKERLAREELAIKNKQLEITERIGLGKIAAMQGRGTAGNTKAMVDQILKMNKPLLEELSLYNKLPNPTEKQKAYIKKLKTDIAANEAQIKAYYNKQGLAGTQSSASDLDPLGLLD